MKQRLLFVFYILTVTNQFIQGQSFSDKDFTLYAKADGLSNNNITGVAQDASGYLWLSTPTGINRYNGTNFRKFYSSEDSSSPLSDETYALTWIDRYRLAIYSVGLYIVDTRSGKTRPLTIPYHDKHYQYRYNTIVSVKSDQAGNIFIGSRSGFYQYNKELELVFRYDKYSAAETKVEHFHFTHTMLELDDERLVVVSSGGLYIYNKRERRLRKMVPGDCPLLAEFLNYPAPYRLFLQKKAGQFFIIPAQSDSLIYINIPKNRKTVSRLPFSTTEQEFHYRTRLFPISDSVFYLSGQRSGLYKMSYDAQSDRVKLYPEKILPRYLCMDLLIDKSNNLWIATNKGLLRHDPRNSHIQQTTLPASLQDSFPNNSFLSIEASSDTIYTGVVGIKGLFLFDKKTFRFIKRIGFAEHTKQVNYAMQIRSISPADPDNLILALDGPLLLFNKKTQRSRVLHAPGWNLKCDWANETFRDSRGHVWISGPGVYRYNGFKHTITPVSRRQLLACMLNMPSSIREDGEGNMWMAGHGLARYNVAADSFDVVLDSFPYIRMPDKQVCALANDRLQNTLWFPSRHNGLICYDMKTKKYRHFTRNNGLPGNGITSLIIIDGKLWMACGSGVACMDLNSLQIVSFGKEDGFPDLPLANGSRFYYDSAHQQLYLGYTNVMVRFNPQAMLQSRPFPHVFIEEMVINGQQKIIFPGSRITTSWQDNDILVTIGSINYNTSAGQRFAYSIIKDKNGYWQELGEQPSFNISNLSPGEHRIQVKAYSLNNRFPEQLAEITIVVLPPFWLNTWFTITAVAIVLLLIYQLVNWRTRIVRRKEMEKTNVEKMKTDYYKTQYELEQISNYFSSSIAGKKKVEGVLWNVAQHLIGKMNYVDCMIYLWNEDKTKMVQKAAYGPKGTAEAIKTHVFDVLPGQGVVGHVMLTREPILIADTGKDHRYRIDDAARLSEICVPIIHNGELIGVIDSEHPELAWFNERDLQILTTIATLLGNKLKQIESEQSLHLKQQELKHINEQLAEAKLSALQAQMNPHFTFNALNSIKRMILDEENEKASTYLSKFAEMIRMTLNHSKDVFVTLEETISYLETYLDMEQLRFDKSFTWHIHTSDTIDTEETLIPSLVIQPLAENAIWHGLKQVEGEKKLIISFEQDNHHVTCTIKDNGIGIRNSERLKKVYSATHSSVGLDNLRNRVRIMNEKFNTDCSLNITDLQDNGGNERGTLVTLRFNLINKYESNPC